MNTSHPTPATPARPAPAAHQDRSARRVGGAGRRLAVAGTLAAGVVLLSSAPALAHVSVQPGEAEQGGYATINFKVPNERDDASTVKLEVAFPLDQPMSSVMPQPVPGWQVKVTKATLDKPLESHGKKITEAVNKVTWTADGDDKGVQPGQFQQFPLSVGQLPKADQMVFKALQTYSDKEVVRWIEEPKEGAPEPESPAPVLKLVAAPAADGAAPDAASGQRKDGDGTTATATKADDDSDTTARVLGGIGIAAGVAGVAFGVLAGRRRSS
ncbi:YcnI family protein [Streptomyces sp. NPDC057702]|uniref:YcnI family copper-binding membrane protein n=1 Tax=unclassified Streptomyces TaxID=2593676 RepID=UPI0036D01AFA